MKIMGKALLAGLFAALLGSCTNYTEEYPEGYTTTAVPLGYAAVTVAGIAYWNNHDHYYRYWPDRGYVVVRPPHNRPPYHRPPARPPGYRPPGHKPSHPIAKPPGHRPPSTQPVTRPSTRPTTRPSTRPSSRPTARPSQGRSRSRRR